MNLITHLMRQMAFARATFGPGRRTAGLIDHIRKELDEVAESGGSADEWVDVVILALDGLTREIAYREDVLPDPGWVAERACEMLAAKQHTNEDRDWPDWRTADPARAIEHVRSPE